VSIGGAGAATVTQWPYVPPTTATGDSIILPLLPLDAHTIAQLVATPVSAADVEFVRSCIHIRIRIPLLQIILPHIAFTASQPVIHWCVLLSLCHDIIDE
jgi:hypothetical protein